jgi:hypothetical protein
METTVPHFRQRDAGHTPSFLHAGHRPGRSANSPVYSWLQRAHIKRFVWGSVPGSSDTVFQVTAMAAPSKPTVNTIAVKVSQPDRMTAPSENRASIRH